MDRELEQYYEERFSTMATKGWQEFVEDTQDIFNAYNNLGGISTVEELHYKKGQLDILNWILTLRDVSTKAYEELKLEETI